MADRYSLTPEDYPRAREEWDDRDVVPPRERFTGQPPGRSGRDPNDRTGYERARGGDQDWMELPPAAAAGMAGWAQPYDYPLRRPGYGDHGGRRSEQPDEYWHARDQDRRPGHGYLYGGPPGGETSSTRQQTRCRPGSAMRMLHGAVK